MRDGSHLLVDLVRPDSPGGFPALMAASPYPRQLQDTGAPFGFVEAGASDFFVPRRYVHVLVNVRGTGGSDGTYGLFDAQERRDLYDVIEWVAAQPWCHGNVGMVGISAFAVAQFQAAVERPPHLRAVFPMAATLDLYEAFYHHGVFSERFATGLVGGIAVMASKTSRLFRNPVVDGVSRVLRTRGVHRRFQHFKGESAIAALAKVGARHIRAAPGDDLFVAVAVDHPTRDEFWAERDLAARLSEVDVPCYLGCDWDNVPLHLLSTFTAWDGLAGRVPVRMGLLGSGGLTAVGEPAHRGARLVRSLAQRSRHRDPRGTTDPLPACRHRRVAGDGPMAPTGESDHRPRASRRRRALDRRGVARPTRVRRAPTRSGTPIRGPRVAARHEPRRSSTRPSALRQPVHRVLTGTRAHGR
jgi:hypothetical protein